MAIAPEEAALTPSIQTMSDNPMFNILGSQKGILMRQKLDIMDMFCPALNKENKYKVAGKPDNGDDPRKYEDKVFKKALKKDEILTMKEKSSCCCRICCGYKREFTMKVKAGDDVADDGTLAQFYRPFKCNIIAGGCCVLCPSEIQVRDKKFDPDTDDKETGYSGKARFFWQIPGSCCGKQYWEILDKNDKRKYVMQRNLCCNTNLCAPSICCPAHVIDIYDKEQTEKVGQLTNLFPGCNWRACVGDADNYMVSFPKNAEPSEKATILAANVLIDYMIFEKKPGDEAG